VTSSWSRGRRAVLRGRLPKRTGRWARRVDAGCSAAASRAGSSPERSGSSRDTSASLSSRRAVDRYGQPELEPFAPRRDRANSFRSPAPSPRRKGAHDPGLVAQNGCRPRAGLRADASRRPSGVRLVFFDLRHDSASACTAAQESCGSSKASCPTHSAAARSSRNTASSAEMASREKVVGDCGGVLGA